MKKNYQKFNHKKCQDHQKLVPKKPLKFKQSNYHENTILPLPFYIRRH